MSRNGARNRGDRQARRAGAVLIYVTIAMIVFMGLVSLGVDAGRVRLVKMQLQHAADAAARYGLVGLATSVANAQSNAVAAAADNKADGTSVVIDPTLDIDFGTWTAGSGGGFTVLTGAAQSNANALRVTARRVQSRSTAITLIFMAAFGQRTCDVHAVSIAAATGGYGLVGLNSITMAGNSSISYWSPTGTTSQKGSIASNGSIALNGSSNIQGDAKPGAGYSVTLSGTASVTGSTTPLTRALSYPNGSAGSYATTNDNANLASAWFNSGTLDLLIGGNAVATYPGGNYYIRNLSLGSNASLTFTGPTTLYVTGSLTLSGSTATASSIPKNLSIVMVGSGAVNVGSSAALYANIYAPQSAVTLSGSGDIYGSVLGLSINMTGSSGIHYDLALPGAWGITLVQ